MPLCVLFVSSRPDIIFNLSAGAITDRSQSAKDIDPYFKSQLYVEDSATEGQYSFYRMGWVNSESQRMTEIKFSAWVGIEPTNYWSIVNVLSLSYHRSILICSLLVRWRMPIIRSSLDPRAWDQRSINWFDLYSLGGACQYSFIVSLTDVGLTLYKLIWSVLVWWRMPIIR